MREAWLEIDTEAIKNNCQRIIKKTQVDLMAVVKANGYGHGIVQVSHACEKGGAKMLAVADLNEAIRVREAGVGLPVLIFNWIPEKYVRDLIANDFIYSLSDIETAKALNEEARKLGRILKVNLCFDTGMHRFGLQPNDLENFLKEFDALTSLDAEGAYSHFADPNNIEYRNLQLDLFNNMLFQATQSGYNFKYSHMGRSGTLDYDDAYFDMNRCGLALYGTSEIIDGLEPAMQFKSIVLSIEKVAANEKVGYELTYTTTKPTTLAVLAVGYSNGYDKRFSNNSEVLVNYKKCPVVGKVCMNHTIVDITGISAKVGDEVVLIGTQGEAEITAQYLAKKLDSSVHEILAGLPSNLDRVYGEKYE